MDKRDIRRALSRLGRPRPTLLNQHNGTATQVIVRDGRRFTLLWTFDPEGVDGRSLQLAIYLTKAEAKKVLLADPLVEGVLEPVRRKLSDPSALLIAWGESDHKSLVSRYSIPRDGTECEFISDLDAAAGVLIQEEQPSIAQLGAELSAVLRRFATVESAALRHGAQEAFA